MKKIYSIVAIIFILTIVWSGINCNQKVSKSSINTLSGLTISTGTLKPGFSSETTSYTVWVPNDCIDVSVTPTAEDQKAQIAVRLNSGTENEVESGAASGNLSLIEGTNTIEVIVTAENGTEEIYSIETKRSRRLVTVEGGTFTMGDTWEDGNATDDDPTHDVTISTIAMGAFEITNGEVVEAYNWAEERNMFTTVNSNTATITDNTAERQLLDLQSGYAQLAYSGGGFSVKTGGTANEVLTDYPCMEISWYGAVAYCNFRSEMEGFTPCYDLTDWSCDFTADGYRLPTEAEWEYAAKGGKDGNYTMYSGSDTLGDVAWFSDNSMNTPHSNIFMNPLESNQWCGTHVIGTKNKNEINIYDMSGNIGEWCWDYYGFAYYQECIDSNITDDPKGPASGTARVYRPSSYASNPLYISMVSYRASQSASTCNFTIGFRVVKSF